MPDFEEKYTINLSNLSICYRKAVMTKRKKKKKKKERERKGGEERERTSRRLWSICSLVPLEKDS